MRKFKCPFCNHLCLKVAKYSNGEEEFECVIHTMRVQAWIYNGKIIEHGFSLDNKISVHLVYDQNYSVIEKRGRQVFKISSILDITPYNAESKVKTILSFM